jgi:hypothetical protein
VLVMMTEGGETKLNTNINFLLEELGVMANSGEPPNELDSNFVHVLRFRLQHKTNVDSGLASCMKCIQATLWFYVHVYVAQVI